MNTFLRFVAAVGFVTTCGMAHAYDATADFSTLSNPNGVWQYGYSVGNGAYNFTLFDRLNPTVPGWISSTYSSLGAPTAWKNTTGGTMFGVAPGQISLHPGRDPFSPTILRFVAPADGDYSFLVQFFQGATGVMSGTVILNGNLADPLASFFSTDGDPSTAGSIPMNAGDSFDVAVGNHGSFADGNTPIEVSIILDGTPPIPEPRTMLMFMAGLAVLIGLSRRRGTRAPRWHRS